MKLHDPDSTQAKVALTFARALVEGRYADAHAMLTPELAAEQTAGELGAVYEDMISIGDGPPEVVEGVTTLDEWPDKEPGDIGWAYVAIYGDGFSEAVAVVVTEHEGQPAIRYIEWGRP